MTGVSTDTPVINFTAFFVPVSAYAGGHPSASVHPHGHSTNMGGGIEGHFPAKHSHPWSAHGFGVLR